MLTSPVSTDIWQHGNVLKIFYSINKYKTGHLFLPITYLISQVAPYCASKWAVEGLTRSVAKELPSGVGVVALNPGVINTDMLASCFGNSASLYQTPESWYVFLIFSFCSWLARYYLVWICTAFLAYSFLPYHLY